MRAPLIERAYQLAASGHFPSSEGVQRALKAEGYPEVHWEFAGADLQRRLNAICRGKPLPPRRALTKRSFRTRIA